MAIFSVSLNMVPPGCFLFFLATIWICQAVAEINQGRRCLTCICQLLADAPWCICISKPPVLLQNRTVLDAPVSVGDVSCCWVTGFVLVHWCRCWGVLLDSALCALVP